MLLHSSKNICTAKKTQGVTASKPELISVKLTFQILIKINSNVFLPFVQDKMCSHHFQALHLQAQKASLPQAERQQLSAARSAGFKCFQAFFIQHCRLQPCKQINLIISEISDVTFLYVE